MTEKNINLKGLSQHQVEEKLKTVGANALPEVAVETTLHKLLQQFNNPLIYILLFALAVDLGIWFYHGAEKLPVEALAILIILVANAGLGLWQNLKSEAALSKLKNLTAPKSWVIREGRLTHIESSQLVPGDIVRVEAGERIPADGQASQPDGFMVDESILTGESAPVDVAVEQKVFSGTLAVRGFALVQITDTGSRSAMGRLATMLQQVSRDKTPLEKRLAVMGRKIAIAVVLIAIVLLVAGLSTVGLSYFSQIFLFAVALAVAAVPESLPAVITLALALGVERMAKRNAVVRKMSAVEALGSVTVIATDKTGTLTENKMSVEKLDCTDQQQALLAMLLVNDADLETGAGDPLEVGMLNYVESQEAVLLTDQYGSIAAVKQRYQKISCKPFDAEWKYMRVTVVPSNQQGEQQNQQQPVSYLKGAPEVILSRSDLSDAERQQWQDKINTYTGQGYRALAIAYGEGEAEDNLQFLGLILLVDPPRQEIPGSIARAQAAGIRVLMITGDHPATAKEIGRQIGISSDSVLTGEEVESKAEQELFNIVSSCNIYARVSPEHKLRIVKALQQQGEVVAVTGDGVNDAPALKASDVGVAMGQRGSDVSREVADLVLLDDNFATIINAVEEGRSIYENIQKVIRSLFSTNMTEVVLISIGALIAFQLLNQGAELILPLTAAQILWINLLTDSLPALAITVDKNPGVLAMPPRQSSSPLLDRSSLQFIVWVGMIGSLFALAILLLLPQFGVDVHLTQTITFCYLTVVQLFFMFPARRSNILPKKNVLVFAAVLTALIAQMLVLVLPQGRALLGLVVLDVQVLTLLLALVFVSWALAEGVGFYLRKRVIC